jgi:hypothetical protein
LDAMSENCVFYISPMYEFSHSLDPKQTSARVCETARAQTPKHWVGPFRMLATGRVAHLGLNMR